MEGLGTILKRGQGLSITNIPDLIKEAIDRNKARHDAVLYPKWNGEDWVSTTCISCEDIGWYMKGISGTGSDSESTWKQVECGCGIRLHDAEASRLKYSGIPCVAQKQTFSTFTSITGTESVLEAAKSIIVNPTVTLVLLYGGRGNGKSHLAHASGMEAIKQGHPTRFLRCSQLLREFKGAKSQGDGGQQAYEAIFMEYLTIPYLIIDEFSWRTEADIDMLEDIVCEREAEYRMTLLTSNHDKSDIDDAFPRVYSRLLAKTSILALNDAPDYRVEK